VVIIIGSADYYNPSAKAGECESGEAVHLVQIISSADYYNTRANKLLLYSFENAAKKGCEICANRKIYQ
jgi:hypothetical protein